MRATDHRRGQLIGALALACCATATRGGSADAPPAAAVPPGYPASAAGPAAPLMRLRQALAAERDGRGTAAATAGALIEAATALGWPELAHDVAVRYYRGDGVPRDLAAARAWWRRAAEAGLPEAQYDYGVLLATGVGGPADAAQARQWWQRAAGQGLSAARTALATLAPARRRQRHAEPAEAIPAAALETGPPAPRAPAAIESDGASWLRARPAAAWTLQLASGESADGLRRLLAAARLDLPAAVVAVSDGERVLYTALAGEFERRSDAVAALASLPDDARRFGPRVRRMRTLQAMLPAADSGTASATDD